MNITLNEMGRDKHVGEIERYIQTVKEQVRCIFNTLPFKQIPTCMVIEMAKYAVFWLNSFPKDNGVSKDHCPRTIVTSQTID